MKRLILLLGILLPPTASLCAQPGVRIARGPWLQAVTEDGFTVVWTTTATAVSWVEIAPDDGSHFYAQERPKYYDSHIGKRRMDTLHRVRIGGLEPGRTYRYRIMQQGVVCNEGNKRVTFGEAFGSDLLKQPPYTATTLDPKRAQTTFWMVNDIHAQDSVFRLLMNGIDKARPDFVCFNGDMLTQIENEDQLMDGYLHSSAELITRAGIPICAVRGNHENRGAFAPRFLDYFPTTTDETYYAFRQGPAFFIVLDGGEDKPDSDIRYYGLSTTDAYREQEATWLRKVVASEAFRSAPVRIVLIHMPPNMGRGWHGELEVARLFIPTLNKAGINLMLCGHYHKYSYIDDRTRGTEFPILINSNHDKVVVDVDSKGISAKVVNTAGKIVKQHQIDKKHAPKQR